MRLKFGDRRSIDLRDATVGKWKENHCIDLFEPGPKSKICFDCALFSPGKLYGKCELRGTDKSDRVAHDPKWPSCGKFVQVEGREK